MTAHDRIVVGASAGGVTALQDLVARLPADLSAAIFITLHMFTQSESYLPDILNKVGPLKASMASDGQLIENGRIYIAPPDYHLFFSHDAVHLGHGPKEGLQRPSINFMFRSAAATFGERVAGVLLTGMLDDGAAGLWEILQRGGITIVQDPEEAAYRSMPESAIRGLNVQYIVRIKEIPPLLTRLSMGERHEMKLQLDASLPGVEPERAPLTRQACPECGGVMRLEHRGEIEEFTCHVGHRLGLQSMILDKKTVIERMMWRAVSQSEELIDLLEQAQGKSEPSLVPSLQSEIQSHRRDLETVRAVLERRGPQSGQSFTATAKR